MKEKKPQEKDKLKKNERYKTTGLDNVDEDATTPATDSTAARNGDFVNSLNESSSSPGNTSMCSMSTVATGPVTPMTSLAVTPCRVPLVKPTQPSSLKERRDALNREALFMFLLAGFCFNVFLYFYLSFMALMAWALFVVTSCCAFYFVYERLLLEYDALLHGRGIGDYLPRSLYVQLAEMSLHEWMMDSTTFNEFRHLGLYFLPGISEAQLEEMIERLPPRRREALQRRGLGQVFGNDFMRLLMGDARWQPPATTPPPQLVLESQQEATLEATTTRSRGLVLPVDEAPVSGDSPPVRSITAEPVPRRLYEGAEDETSDIESHTEESSTSRADRGTRQIATREQGETHGDWREQEESEEIHHDWELEGQVIYDAMYEMMMTYSSQLLSSSTLSLRQWAVWGMDIVSPLVIGIGVSTTSISTGVGLLGVWYGAYDASWSRGLARSSTTTSTRFPAGRVLLYSGLFGGMTAGVMLLVRRGVRRALQAPNEKQNSAREPKGKKS